MYQMVKAWRSVVALAAAGAAVLGAAADVRADEGFSFTAEKYSAVPFGMPKAEVWGMLGGGQTKPGDAAGWCEDDGKSSILCFTTSSDYAPYGDFSFNADGKLYSKRHEFLFTPKTPSMTLAKYNTVQLGMTEAQLWSIVSQDSCVPAGERYPNWPATTGREVNYYCTAAKGLFPPNASFYITDGKVTEKYQRALS
ncbi:BLIP family protein [Streptomyces sp. NPDC002785]|uniref:BLIP family protein n=1 Tax=Streptomyces sp. NPDC002785 TaxID=3154543 RepID=UPI00332F93D5